LKKTRKSIASRLFALAVVGFSLRAAPQANPYQTAISLQQQGKLAEAAEAWKTSAKEHPSDPFPLAELGLLESRQEHYSQAVAYYREAMALNASMPGLRLNMGLALFKTGKYQETIDLYLPLLKNQTPSSPESQRLTVLVGMAYFGLGQYAAAIPYLSQASSSDPQNLPLLLTLAHSCLLSKQYQCVLDSYHQLVAKNAESAEADMLVGEALDEKDPVGATHEFRSAIAANPKEPNAHFGLGYLLWTQKQYPEAAIEFKAELENTPGYTQAELYLADTYIQLNNIKGATPILERIVRTNPELSMARLDLGAVYFETGRNGEALQQLTAAESLKPTDINVHWKLGRLYRAMGKTTEAKQEFEKAQTLNKAADDALLDVLTTSPESEKPSPDPPAD
jgi:tetratricopeptide (TPR) repeat protein